MHNSEKARDFVFSECLWLHWLPICLWGLFFLLWVGDVSKSGITTQNSIGGLMVGVLFWFCLGIARRGARGLSEDRFVLKISGGTLFIRCWFNHNTGLSKIVSLNLSELGVVGSRRVLLQYEWMDVAQVSSFAEALVIELSPAAYERVKAGLDDLVAFNESLESSTEALRTSNVVLEAPDLLIVAWTTPCVSISPRITRALNVLGGTRSATLEKPGPTWGGSRPDQFCNGIRALVQMGCFAIVLSAIKHRLRCTDDEANVIARSIERDVQVGIQQEAKLLFGEGNCDNKS